VELIHRAMLFDGVDVFAVSFDSPSDLNEPRGSARFDTKRNGREGDEDAFDQGGTRAAEGFDTPTNAQSPYWLRNLNGDGAVAVRHDTVEFSVLNRACIDVETARALPKGFDGCFDPKFAQKSKINESDGARSM
jgi:hypothetical protein